MLGSGSMAWIAPPETEEKVLHLKIGQDNFSPFWEFPFARLLEVEGQGQVAHMDFELSDRTGKPQETLRHSKGWHCYQKLFAQGWKLECMAQAA